MSLPPRHRLLVACAAFACLSGGNAVANNPRLPTAPLSDAVPFPAALAEDLARREVAAGTAREALDAVAAAAARAAEALAAPRDRAAVDEAAALARGDRFATARAAAMRVLADPVSSDVADAASAVCSYAAWRDDRCDREDRCGDRPAPFNEISGHLAYWRADCALERDEPARARDLARTAIGTLPLDIEQHDARFVEARARLRIPGSEAQAIADILELLGRYPEYPHTATLSLELATAELALGRSADAVRRLDRLDWNRPWHPRAAEARELLAALGRDGYAAPPRGADAWLERGRALRSERQWPHADAALREAVARFVADGDAASADAARYELALNSYDRADFAAALELLDDVATRAHVRDRDVARWRARTLSRLDREAEALESYLAFFSHHGASDEDRVITEFALDIGAWDEAIRRARARGEMRPARTFDAAFLLYLGGELTEARDALDAVAARSSGVDRTRALYWLGRAQQKLGEREAARATWARAYEDNPRNYFGMQARNRSLELPAPDAPDDAPLARSPAHTHFRELGAISANGTPGGFFAVPASPLAADGGLEAFAATWGHLFPRAQVAEALYRVGALEEARRAFRDVALEFGALDAAFANGRTSTRARPIRLEHERWEHEIDNRGRPADWWGMVSSELRFPTPTGASLDAHIERHAAIRTDRALIRAALDLAMIDVGEWHILRRRTLQRGVGGAPDASDERWLRAYPLAYRDRIAARGLEFDVSPWLVWAIMIVESELNPDSISSADAYGLLQVIPKTGQRIQLDVGDIDFGTHQLIDPAASIRYGTWYLAQLTHNFRGQELLAAVAYNAGPHQVARWMQWRCDGLDFDEFLETVPFAGARRYAQRTYQHMATFASLYYGAPHLYLGNAIHCEPTYQIYY